MIRTDNNTGRLYTVDRRLRYASGRLAQSKTLHVFTDRCNVVILPDMGTTKRKVSLQRLDTYDHDELSYLLLFNNTVLMPQELLRKGDVVYLSKIVPNDDKFEYGDYEYSRNSVDKMYSRIVEAESIDLAEITRLAQEKKDSDLI